MKRPDPAHQPPNDLWAALSVTKLQAYYDPFRILGLKNRDRDYYANARQEPTHKAPGKRQREYSRQRIAWLLVNGWTQPPELDWVWSGLHPVNPCLVDGHHRFCAAILARDKQLIVEYSGPVNRISALE